MQNTLTQMTALTEHRDGLVVKRAESVLPRRRKDLEGRWNWLRQGLDKDAGLPEMRGRVRGVQQLEDLVAEITSTFPYITGDTDLAELARAASALKLAYTKEFTTLKEPDTKEGKVLLDKATVAVKENSGLTATRQLIDEIVEFRQRVFKTADGAVGSALPDGYFDTTIPRSLEELQDWVAAKVAGHKEGTATTTDISQVVNDLAADRSKAANHLTDGTPVLHASAGKAGTGSSCSLFFVKLADGLIRIVAVGQHKGKIKGKEAYTMLWSHPDYTTDKVYVLG